jgi:hypothetical protein
MKMFHVLFAVGILSFGSCRKSPVVNLTPNLNDTAPPLATPEAVVPVPLPDAEPASTAAAAPHREYFLRAATSVQTANGRVSFPPGTRLQQVGPGTYTAQGQTLTLRNDQVTTDLKLVRQPTATDQSVQTGLGGGRQEPLSDLAPVSAETARQLSTDPQYQALSERAANLRSKIERVSREVSRIPNTTEKAAPTAAALKKEREKLEGELRAITEEQTLLRTSK